MPKSFWVVVIRGMSVAALGTALFSEGALAAQRTFVASYGNDVANLTAGCTRVLPCRSFGAAITKTGISGEIIVLDSAGYGPVTITQSVSIISPTGVYAGMTVFAGNGVTIATNNVHVVLRGLAINGQGAGNDGIFVDGTGIVLSVENCTIADMGVNGVDVHTPSGRVTISDSTIRGHASHGVVIDATSASIENSRIAANGKSGMYASDGATVTVSRSIVTGNHDGLFAWAIQAGANATTQMSVDATEVTDNTEYGIWAQADQAGNEARVGVTKSTVARNNFGIIATAINNSAVVASASANLVEGNASIGIYLFCNSGSKGYVSAAGNMVIRNSIGINSLNFGVPPADCVFRTIGTNMVRENIIDLSGPITVTAGD